MLPTIVKNRVKDYSGPPLAFKTTWGDVVFLSDMPKPKGVVRHPRQRRWLDEWCRLEGDRTLAAISGG